MTAIDGCWRRIGVSGDRSCPELRLYVHCRNCPTYADAATRLLDRAPPGGYLEEWSEHLASAGVAKPVVAATPPVASLTIFRVAGEWLALPTTVVHEVAELRVVHSLPHRRNGILLGIVNLQGTLVVCVSLGALLGLAAETTPDVAQPRLLVIGGTTRRDSTRFVFRADAVYGLLRPESRALSRVPATLGGASARFSQALLTWQDRKVGCLDATLVLAGLERGVA